MTTAEVDYIEICDVRARVYHVEGEVEAMARVACGLGAVVALARHLTSG